MSLQGNRVLITTVGDSNTGAAYVFDFYGNIWNQSQKLTASDATASDEFGFSASLSNNRLVIGVHLDDSNGNNSGSVYVFDENGNNWSQTDKVLAVVGSGSVNDSFGNSVSISGNRAQIGARDNNGNTSRSAYIFDFDGNSWHQTKKIIPLGGGKQDDQFGIRVSLSVNRDSIGPIGDNGNSGSAYIFDFDGNSWNLTQNIIAPDGNFGDFFGKSVSLSGNRVLIEGDGDDDRGNSSGSAYIFTDINDLIFENGFEN